MSKWRQRLERIEAGDSQTKDQSGGGFGNFDSFGKAVRPKALKPANPTIRIGPDYSDPLDVVDWFNERAAIIEEGCAVSRQEAERRAYECLIVDWLNRATSKQEDSTRCVRCKSAVSDQDAVPVLDGKGGHYVIHDACWPAWMRERRAAAEKALAAYGLSSG